MTLTAGTRLGPFEIVAPPGEGGPPPFAADFRTANDGEPTAWEVRTR